MYLGSAILTCAGTFRLTCLHCTQHMFGTAAQPQGRGGLYPSPWWVYRSTQTVWTAREARLGSNINVRSESCLPLPSPPHLPSICPPFSPWPRMPIPINYVLPICRFPFWQSFLPSSLCHFCDTSGLAQGNCAGPRSAMDCAPRFLI